MTSKSLTGQPPSPVSASERRIRLAASATVFASALGAAAILTSVIVHTGIYDDPEHLTFVPSVVSALTGALAAGLVTPLAIYHARDRAEDSGGVLTWLALGLGFGLASSFVTGGLLPLSAVMMSLAEGAVGLGELPSQALEAALRGIRSFYIEGTLAIFTWLLAGAIFGTGGWALDKLNASPSIIASRYGTLGRRRIARVGSCGLRRVWPAGTLRNLG